MYSERCGTVIPGIHGICHQDDYSIHGEKRILVNGGYHDAGDLSPTGNTPGMSYALFELAERLKHQGEDPLLYNRLIVEAEWGFALSPQDELRRRLPHHRPTHQLLDQRDHGRRRRSFRPGGQRSRVEL
jgi:hypothetical protein